MDPLGLFTDNFLVTLVSLFLSARFGVTCAVLTPAVVIYWSLSLMLCFVSQVRLFNGGPDAYVMILISVLPLQACFDYLLRGMPTPLPVEGSVDSLSATELSVLLKLLGVSGTFCPSESPWCQRRFSLCYRGGQPLFLWNFLSSRISLMAASILSPTGAIGPSLGLG